MSTSSSWKLRREPSSEAVPHLPVPLCTRASQVALHAALEFSCHVLAGRAGGHSCSCGSGSNSEHENVGALRVGMCQIWPQRSVRRGRPLQRERLQSGGRACAELPQQRLVIDAVARADVCLRRPLSGWLAQGLVEQPVLQWEHWDQGIDGADGLHVRLLPLPRQVTHLLLEQFQYKALHMLVLDAHQPLEYEWRLVVDQVLSHPVRGILAKQVQDFNESKRSACRPRWHPSVVGYGSGCSPG